MENHRTSNDENEKRGSSNLLSHQEEMHRFEPASDLPIPEVERAEVQMFEPLMEIIAKIADGERVPPQITMRYEMLRFCTLRSFPKHNKPFITRIAAAGFYFANTDDEVVCYSCARRKRNWCWDDNPLEIHRELNPNCSFLLRNSEVNVPVRMSEIHQDSTRATHSRTHQNTTHAGTTSACGTISQNTNTQSSQSELIMSNSSQNISQAISSQGNLSSSIVDPINNTILPNRIHQRDHGNFVQTITPSPSSIAQELQSNRITVSSNSHDTQIVSSSTAMPTSQLSAEGAYGSTAPKYPKYATKTARLTSFNDCGDIVIPPESLETSGFFYAGFGDCVRCFHCGVGLRHWSDEDDPWIEHCRWSKDCLFVTQVKGQEFVNLVQMAVQYSQNMSGDNKVSNNNCVPGHSIENLMNTNAAQSVLEMGYSSDIVGKALQAIRHDDGTIDAFILLETIFGLENFNSCETCVAGTKHNQSKPVFSKRADDTKSRTERCLYVARSSSPNSTIYGETSFNSLEADMASFQNTPTVISLNGADLSNENQRLRDQLYCIECKNIPREVVFLSCPFPHLLFCNNCYLNHDICPLCYTPVKALLHVRR